MPASASAAASARSNSSAATMFAKPSLRAVARDHRVAPGAFVVAGLGEVQREQRRLLVGSLAGAELERLPDAAVDLAPAAERETLVRRRAHQVVAEGERPVASRHDELAEPVPARLVAGTSDLVAQDLVEQLELERRTDDGRVAQQHPVGGSSVSIRVVSSVSTDSGSSSGAPCRAAKTSSRRNSGLPPARPASVSTASVESACSCATASANASAAASVERLQLEARARPSVGQDRLGAPGARHADEPGARRRAGERGAAAGTATRRRASACPRRRSASASSAPARGTSRRSRAGGRGS